MSNSVNGNQNFTGVVNVPAQLVALSAEVQHVIVTAVPTAIGVYALNTVDGNNFVLPNGAVVIKAVLGNAGVPIVSSGGTFTVGLALTAGGASVNDLTGLVNVTVANVNAGTTTAPNVVATQAVAAYPVVELATGAVTAGNLRVDLYYV